MKHTKEDLAYLQNLNLEHKIRISQTRIIEWEIRNKNKTYISFSGGKDSTVLLDLVKKVNRDVPAVFIDTGLEYPEVRSFALEHADISIKPKMTFNKVIEKYGYPIINKEQSLFIFEYRNTKSEKLRNTRLNGNKYGQGKISNKWKYLIDADFKISYKCCDVMKKNPAKKYEKDTGRVPYIGTMTNESSLRKMQWLKHGCNAFDKTRPTSNPLSFWSEQDILKYIVKNNLKYASVYGEIVVENGVYHTTGCDRTGCVFCGFGCQTEKYPNRFQRLKKTHPELYTYCIGGGAYENEIWLPNKDGLGMGHVLDQIGVEY